MPENGNQNTAPTGSTQVSVEILQKGYQPKVDAATAQVVGQNPPSGGSSVSKPAASANGNSG